MKVTRYENAENNFINLKMQNIFQNFCTKYNYKIKEMTIYKYAVRIKTNCGKEFRLNISDNNSYNMKKLSKYIYMNQMVNDKSKRIKKELWC